MPPKTPTAGIFIPTMNRVDFIIRQLRYYASIKCPHTIYVGDSSPKEESEKILREIEKLGNTIKARYYYLPSYDSWQSHYHLITEVKEKYICYSGDDDYQIPNSVTNCIDFLETHPDYASASGHAVSFRLKQSGPYGQLKRLADYPRQQIEETTGSERIKHFFNNYYVTHFSVNRTADLVNHWRNDANIQDHNFKSEILPTALPLICGKSKTLDCLGFVRQIHDRRIFLPDTFDWIASHGWPQSYALFKQALSKKLAQKDDIPLEEAAKIIKLSFLNYLVINLQREYEIYHPTRAEKGFSKQAISFVRSKIARTFPILKQLYRMQIKPRLTKKRELNYEVLQPKSKYYQDFKSVADSFTGRVKI